MASNVFDLLLNPLTHPHILSSQLQLAYPTVPAAEISTFIQHLQSQPHLFANEVCKSALIIVDFQNDFIDGSMAVNQAPAGQDPLECLPPLNRLIDSEKFDLIVYTRDWHPETHISFLQNAGRYNVTEGEVGLFRKVSFSEPSMEQVLYPPHCVRDTRGAELHQGLKIHPQGVIVDKGACETVEQYSAFVCTRGCTETELQTTLNEHGIRQVFIGGLVYDICVADTALDALRLGYRTAVLEDCTRGLDQTQIALKKQQLVENGAAILDSCQVDGLLNRTVLPPWTWLKWQAGIAGK